MRDDVVQIARTYFRSAVVAAIGQRIQPRFARRILRRRRYPAEFPVVVSDVSHLVCNDQMMLRVYCRLNVVAHYAGASYAGRRGPCVGIRHGQLFVRLPLQLLPDLLEFAHLVAQADNLLAQPHGFHLEACLTGAVCTFDQLEISLNAFIKLLLALVDFARRVVAIAAVRSLKLAAVDSHHITGQQLYSAAQFDKPTAYVSNG